MALTRGLAVDISESDIQFTEEYAHQVAERGHDHADYILLAGRILVAILRHTVPATFSVSIEKLYQEGLIMKKARDDIQACTPWIDELINQDADLTYDYFAVKSLMLSYLIRDLEGNIAELPQCMLMRVAVQIHRRDRERISETYRALSNKLYTHATPVLFNSCTLTPSVSSCFLVDVKDSLDKIFDALKEMALISKNSGGIGVRLSDLRSSKERIVGTNGHSGGIKPLSRVISSVAAYVDQGGKRKGAINAFLNVHHPDVLDFVDLRLPTGNAEDRARDLFLAVVVPDLFMKRLATAIKNNIDKTVLWSFFDPHSHPELNDTWGEEYERIYADLEARGQAKESLPIFDVWLKIIGAQARTGTPFILFGDTANRSNNQSNLGMIKQSNLCMEVVEVTSDTETSVCNLASINLSAFVHGGRFDYIGLLKMAKLAAMNIDAIIDTGYYPTEKAKRTNQTSRPIAVGIMGLANAFFKMGYAFTSPEAREMNKRIMATIYYGTLQGSTERARLYGAYDAYEGSPIAKGQLHFDMVGVTPDPAWDLDWETLRKDIAKYGVRNSLTTALMPCASTAHIMGQYESFEPIFGTVFSRLTLSGDFSIVCNELVQDLTRAGLWSKEMADRIIACKGDLKQIKEIPRRLCELYKSVWEIDQKDLIDMAADRQPYISQAQSLNLYVAEPSVKILTNQAFQCWKKGLKTIYYLRSRPAASAIQWESLSTPPPSATTEEPAGAFCTRENGCVSCSV